MSNHLQKTRLYHRLTSHTLRMRSTHLLRIFRSTSLLIRHRPIKQRDTTDRINSNNLRHIKRTTSRIFSTRHKTKLLVNPTRNRGLLHRPTMLNKIGISTRRPSGLTTILSRRNKKTRPPLNLQHTLVTYRVKLLFMSFTISRPRNRVKRQYTLNTTTSIIIRSNYSNTFLTNRIIRRRFVIQPRHLTRGQGRYPVKFRPYVRMYRRFPHYFVERVVEVCSRPTTCVVSHSHVVSGRGLGARYVFIGILRGVHKVYRG